ncbi:MAG: STAS domain-containing protein [bacterium]
MIPIIEVEGILVVPVQETLHDRLALDLQHRLGDEIAHSNPRGVIIDISTVEVLDSFIARVLDQIGQKCLLMGLQTVVVGMQPAVAMTLVEMGMDLAFVHTALNINSAMRLFYTLDYTGEAEEAPEREVDQQGLMEENG